MSSRNSADQCLALILNYRQPKPRFQLRHGSVLPFRESGRQLVNSEVTEWVTSGSAVIRPAEVLPYVTGKFKSELPTKEKSGPMKVFGTNLTQ